MDKINIIIADPSKEQLQNLITFFSSYENINIIAKCCDGAQLLSTLKNIQADFLIFDIFVVYILIRL